MTRTVLKKWYVVKSNYGYGWDTESRAATSEEAEEDLKAYRENMRGGSFKICIEYEEEREEMTRLESIKELLKRRSESGRRSAWTKAVTAYAEEFLETLEEWPEAVKELEELPEGCYMTFEKMLLNGAESWKEYSWGGCSLIYDEDIARRTCSPSELKKTKYGQNRPNKSEEWLDTQARALYQAAQILKGCYIDSYGPEF